MILQIILFVKHFCRQAEQKKPIFNRFGANSIALATLNLYCEDGKPLGIQLILLPDTSFEIEQFLSCSLGSGKGQKLIKDVIEYSI